MEVRMNGKGRKLFRSAVGILTSVMMMGAYTTTAMASGIGVIDAKDMLDIHAEANTASAVIGHFGNQQFGVGQRVCEEREEFPFLVPADEVERPLLNDVVGIL